MTDVRLKLRLRHRAEAEEAEARLRLRQRQRQRQEAEAGLRLSLSLRLGLRDASSRPGVGVKVVRTVASRHRGHACHCIVRRRSVEPSHRGIEQASRGRALMP